MKPARPYKPIRLLGGFCLGLASIAAGTLAQPPQSSPPPLGQAPPQTAVPAKFVELAICLTAQRS